VLPPEELGTESSEDDGKEEVDHDQSVDFLADLCLPTVLQIEDQDEVEHTGEHA